METKTRICRTCNIEKKLTNKNFKYHTKSNCYNRKCNKCIKHDSYLKKKQDHIWIENKRSKSRLNNHKTKLYLLSKTLDENKEKLCWKCETIKPINEFYLSKKTNLPDGYCKDCRKKNSKIYGPINSKKAVSNVSDYYVKNLLRRNGYKFSSLSKEEIEFRRNYLLLYRAMKLKFNININKINL